MPRRVRSHSKTNIYHVMLRGNERKNIFLDDEDKSRFLDTLQRISGHVPEAIAPHGTCPSSIYAYCLMDNHVHLLINQGDDTISRIIKRIGTSYAYYFNRKYGRIGHLFQDRFKSEAVGNEAYLLAASRYIHNNPVKAGITEQAGLYRWSSYNEYTGMEKAWQIVQKGIILNLFSDNKSKAVREFIEFTNLGNSDEFLEYAECEESKEIQGISNAKDYVNEYVVNYGIEKEGLRNKENKVLLKQLIKELRQKSNLSIREIADVLGIDRGMVQRETVTKNRPLTYDTLEYDCYIHLKMLK